MYDVCLLPLKMQNFGLRNIMISTQILSEQVDKSESSKLACSIELWNRSSSSAYSSCIFTEY